ncbi:MAG: djlA [Alphaproteobacteria bacterium]|jgi:DnaJ like chaperone protein|nr:djlA [Alphaproteobacteria bacterium]
MSIIGKILGGAAGFAIGGPIAALVGVIAGHAVDNLIKAETAPGPADNTRQIAFTIGVIALGAKMAKADGVVTRAEIDAFRQIFHVPPEETANVARFFDLAKKDARGFEPYARQIAGLFPDSPEVLEKIIEGLLQIARADGRMHDSELDYLRQVAAIFGLDDTRFARAQAAAGDMIDPWQVLGLPRDADEAAIKATWRRLARENHPDRLIAQGMPAEAIDLANKELAAINAAYDAVCRERGIK